MTAVAPAEADVAVVGGGIVGLAVAANLACAGRAVVLLERRPGLAQETSSRNSQVVHAGLYYPPGSRKARLCTRGRELTWARCAARGVPHARTGKLVVACEAEELPALERLAENARSNGVPGLEILDAAAVRDREPHVRARAALHSPETGIVDAHALALSFAAEAEAHGAALVCRAELVAIEPAGERQRLVVRDADGALARLTCSALVNAAGLASDRVAALAGIDADARGWRIHPCKGDYFALAPGAPLGVARPVYPLPASGGALGVHATPDLAGRILFGPDAEYVDEPRLDVDPAKADAFAEAAGRWLPGLRAAWLAPDQAGLRPRLARPGEPARDFEIACDPTGVVHLVGIESPGLTAAPAIAEEVAGLLAASR